MKTTMAEPVLFDSEILRDRLIAMLSEIVEPENISQAKDVADAISSFR